MTVNDTGIYNATNHTTECGTHRGPIDLLKSQGNPEVTVHGVPMHGNSERQGQQVSLSTDRKRMKRAALLSSA